MKKIEYKTTLKDSSDILEGVIRIGVPGKNPPDVHWSGWIPDLNPDNVAPGLIVIHFYDPRTGKRGELEIWTHASNLQRMRKEEFDVTA